MEVHGRSDVAKPDKVSAATSQQADSIPHDDPLADASCLHCGYSLRGLTENRCPECGTPFDPELLASSYLPEWPRLMAWFLTAACLAAFLQLLCHVLSYLGSKVSLSLLMTGAYNLVTLFDLATTLLIAPLAIIGLMRKIDWGRKVAIGLSVAQSVPLLPALIYIIVRLASPGPYLRLSTAAISDILPAWMLVSQVSLPSILLASILWTRLRRRSLRRSATDPVLVLPLKSFPPRGDWLLLLVVLLAAQALWHFGSFGTSALWLLALSAGPSAFATSWRNPVVSLASWGIISALLCAWLVYTARAIWRSPTSTTRCIRSYAIVVAASTITLQIINTLLWPERYALASPGTASFRISATLTHIAAVLTTPLALYLYASRALPAEAIARVAESSEQPTSSNASGSAEG